MNFLKFFFFIYCFQLLMNVFVTQNIPWLQNKTCFRVLHNRNKPWTAVCRNSLSRLLVVLEGLVQSWFGLCGVGDDLRSLSACCLLYVDGVPLTGGELEDSGFFALKDIFSYFINRHYSQILHVKCLNSFESKCFL